MAAATGLMFSISPSKKPIKREDIDDEHYMLILAPFNKSPKINFGRVKLNQIIEKNLLIINPQEFDIILNVKNQDLNINNMNINIGPRSNVNFKLKWQPIKPESYKFTIIFEVLNSRLKFNVHAFGICDEPPKKPTGPRKPLTVLQPIRSLAVDTATKNKKTIEATIKPNKENQAIARPPTSTFQKKPGFQIDSTFIVQESFQNFSQTIHDHTTTTIINDIRRQTVVIQSPTVNSNTKSIELEFDSKTPKLRLRRSISETDLRRNGVIPEESDVDRTPQMDDFLKKRFDFADIQAGNTPTRARTPQLALTSNRTVIMPKANANSTMVVEKMFNLDATVSLIVKSPVLKFNSCLYEDSDDDNDSVLEHYLDFHCITCIIKIQRAVRFRRFHFALKKLREAKQRYDNAVLTVQRWTRAMKQRYEYRRTRRVLVTIQRQWRVKFERKRQAAVKIQRWTRDVKQRYRYLRFRRALIQLQKVIHDKYEEKRLAAVTIQKWTRSMKPRFEYLHKRRVVIRIQQKWRVQHERRVCAAVAIQRWTRVMKPRLEFLRQKRLITRVQQTWRLIYARRRQAAVALQRWTRAMKPRYEFLHQKRVIVKMQQKWRVIFERKRRAAIRIQQWTRGMKQRYGFLQLKHVAVYIQQKYKRKYALRFMAALKIQHYYRVYKFRQLETVRVRRFNEAATQIQAYWRGYKLRKEINIEKLFAIRQRLSVYIQRPQPLTLGARIRRSLHILQHSPSMTSIMTSLIDLKTVTRLSQECCIIFTQSGTIDYLYEFITKCNRSKPHTDLIKLCLEILINLAKCKNTCELIVDNLDKLNIMLHLLQSYQSTNQCIFMNVCILLIILASNNKQRSFVYTQLLNDGVCRKLVNIYQILERRANLRVKTTQPAIGQTSTTQRVLNSTTQHIPMSASCDHLLDSSLNQTNLTAISTSTTLSQAAAASSIVAASSNVFSNITFTFEPEWSLSQQKKIYEFIEPLSVLQFLLYTTLNVTLNTGLSHDVQSIILKTPSKMIDSNVRNTDGSTSSSINSARRLFSTTASSASKSTSGSVVSTQKASIKKTTVMSSTTKSSETAGSRMPPKKGEIIRRKLI